MNRIENLFYNVVKDENSTTEIFCNLMKIKVFRDKFLSLFLPTEVVQEINYENFDTQPSIDYGRPDMIIENEEVSILFELKTSKWCKLTGNQPNEYLKYLETNKDKRHRWLVFLLPQDYLQEKEINSDKIIPNGINLKILYWEQVIDKIEENQLNNLNPFIDEFTNLLKMWFIPKTICFKTEEIKLMFTREIPETFFKLQELINQIGNELTKSFEIGSSKGKEEYGYYFKDSEGQSILWFGIWYKFWIDEEKPICFGIKKNYPDKIKQKFMKRYSNRLIEYKGWYLSWIENITLAGENSFEDILKELYPLLEELIPEPVCAK
jgi:hypothetical protein